MPVVPTEENRVGIAGVTGEKLVPGDFSGSGLDALGAGMQSLGETGQKVAVAQHEQAIEDDAAVKRAWNIYAEQSRVIRADFYARQGSDAASALKPATDALRETVDTLRDGLRGKRQRGIFDRSVPKRLIADLARMKRHATSEHAVDQHKQSIGVQDNSRNDAAENFDDPEQFQRHVHTGIEAMRTQALLQGRDPASVNHEAAHFVSSIHRDVADGLTAHDALAAHQYLLNKAGEMIAPHRDEVARSLVPVLDEAKAVADVDMRDALRSPTAPVTPPGDIAAVTGRMLTVESARQSDGEGASAASPSPGPADEKGNASVNDAPGREANAARAADLSALMRHYRGDAAKAWAASLQGQAGVDALVASHGDAWFGALPEDTRKAVAANMTLLGAATSSRTPPTPEDHASASSWIQAQDWKDDRKQLAHEELHKRIGLANRQRSTAQNVAKETGLALAQKLGPDFISVNQLPPAVRRDLPDDALAALKLRADRNVHPVTVAPHGEVATTLNRMAARHPERFAKEDLRLVRDRVTPGEYASLERTQRGLASYPPAPATVTQRHLWDEMRRNGLDDDPARDGGAVPPSPDEARVDRLANVETIPEALRGTDALKSAVREMLRTGWTSDQVQNQLYEAYVRRSLGLNSGPADQEGGSNQLGIIPSNTEQGSGQGATGAEQTAQLMPVTYSKAKRRTPKAKQPSAADALPEWARRRNLSAWRSPVYLSTSQDSDDKDTYDGLKRMGNPDDLTIVFSHGSPASGKTTDTSRGIDPITGNNRRFIDAKYIFYDLLHKNFVPGTPVLLTSCFGANDDTARQLSAMTGGVVYVAKAYVTTPSAIHQRYDLSVYTEGPGTGTRTGYAKFDNGREVPSELLALRYDGNTHQWSRDIRTPPAPVGDRVPAPLFGFRKLVHDLTGW